MKVWLNDGIRPVEKARVSILDHGFLYGDGIYETVRAYDRKIFRWKAHALRLQESARRIALNVPWPDRYLERVILQTLQANRLRTGSIRLCVSRGPGPLGLDPKLCPRPTLVALPHPSRNLSAFRKTGVRVVISHVRRNPPAALDPQIKSNNFLNNILARIEAEKAKAFEAVLLNLEGYLTEGTTSNIFFVKGKKIYTPALSCGILHGITRDAILEVARKAGFKTVEGRFTPQDLIHADEAFLSSTTMEVMPVVSIIIPTHYPPPSRGRAGAGGHPSTSLRMRLRRIGAGRPGPVTRQLHALLQILVRRELHLP